MSNRPFVGFVSHSALEAFALASFLVGVGGIGLLWGVGVVVGSILGSTVPGPIDESVAAMLAVFPEIGAAWKPPIPSPLIWSIAVVLSAFIGPLLWRLVRAGRLQEEGASWATARDLHRARLLVPDRPLAHSVADSLPDDG